MCKSKKLLAILLAMSIFIAGTGAAYASGETGYKFSVLEDLEQEQEDYDCDCSEYEFHYGDDNAPTYVFTKDDVINVEDLESEAEFDAAMEACEECYEMQPER